MNDDTCKLFERVAGKMGWADEGGLDTVEKKVCCPPHKSDKQYHVTTIYFSSVLSNTSILYQYYAMRLDIVLDFGCHYIMMTV